MCVSSCMLKCIPSDVYDIIIDEQGKEKKSKKKGQFSIELTIYKIIRDYARCKKEEQKNK